MFRTLYFIALFAVSALPAQAAQDNWIVGAQPAPPKGGGPGALVAWQVGTDQIRHIAFGEPHTPSGNSFYVAYDGSHHRLYVPTVAGRTTIFDADSLEMIGSMTSIPGGRVAEVSPDGSVLAVVSGKETAAYDTETRERLFVLPVGGNAVAFDADSRYVYVGGNRRDDIQRIDIAKAEADRAYDVARSGDLVRVHDRLYSADMTTGVMSVIDLATDTVTTVKTPEQDPHFDYGRIPAANAGFMQLAADAQHHRVYAAGFSGHILVFDSDDARYLGEIPVDVKPEGPPDKLSGLTLFDHGRKALVTVENLDTAVVVDLKTRQVERKLAKTASNRWVHMGGS